MKPAAIQVDTDPPYAVHVGAGLLGEVALEGRARGAVLADARAWALHGDKLAALVDVPRLELPPGEATKSFEQLERSLEFLAAAGLDRGSSVFAVGGGVVGDLAGLAAALFKRGVACVQVPTTLLAQVDSSVGGKTAINLRAGKNLAGVVHQPSAVFADTETLSTLDESEWRSGLGEVVKTALIGGPEVLDRLERCGAALQEREPSATADVVAACVRVKADIVAADPFERGQRRVLNLGHTFAHAIEHAAGYGAIPHGVAVAAGIAMAVEASHRAGLLADEGLAERVQRLLTRLGLPTGLDDLRAASGCALTRADLHVGVQHDKKGAVGRPELVLIARAGDVRPGITPPDGLLDALFE